MILRKYLCFACAVLFIQSGYAKEQKPINLGETPWRFSKVVGKRCPYSLWYAGSTCDQ